MTESKLYRSRHLRERYGVSDTTLWRWQRAGKLPTPKFINGQRVWTAEQLEEADAGLMSVEAT